MKKFLSLALALVMTMSLVVVGAGAKTFTDNGKIVYDEAVAVTSAAGIIDGYTDGSFNPTGTLTRGAAAKIICNLILGPTTADALSADAAPFKDVPANHVFAGYIAYCANQGIINGYADGTFKPAGTLTGYQFMKMLLGALGYEGKYEGFTGANWSINVAKLAKNLELDDGNDEFVGTKAVTREEACLYAFNTMKATMVEYDENTQITVGDVVINTTSKAKDMENKTSTDGNIDKDGYMQFAEKYFEDLKGKDTTDDFGAPATKWTYKSDEVGTYSDSPDETYVLNKSNQTIADVLFDHVDFWQLDEDDFAVKDDKNDVDGIKMFINGDSVGAAAGKVKEFDDIYDLKDYSVEKSGDKYANELLMAGDQINLYENGDDDYDTIVVIRYSVAKIDSVDDELTSTYTKKGASYGIELKKLSETFGIEADTSTLYDQYDNDSTKELPGFDPDTYVEDAVLAVAVKESNAQVLDSYVATEVSGTVASFKTGNKAALTVAGTAYPLTGYATTKSAGVSVDFDDSEYVAYLDSNGYVIGWTGDTIANLDDVYYVTLVAKDTGKYSDTYYAQAVALKDGTVTEFKLTDDPNDDADDNDLYSYINEIKNGNTNTVAVQALYSFDKDGGKYDAELYTGDKDKDLYVFTKSGLADNLDKGDSTFRADEKGQKVYIDDDSSFLKVKKDGDDIEVKTATGSVSIARGTFAITVASKSGSTYTVEYTVFASDKFTAGSDDVVYVEDKSETENADGYVQKLYFLDGSGTIETVTTKKANADSTFYTFDIDEDDIYDLTSVQSNNEYNLEGGKLITANASGKYEYDSETGFVLSAYLDTLKSGALSVYTADYRFTADDVDLSDNVIIIDERSAAARDLDGYKNKITTASQLEKAIEKDGWNVVANVYFDDEEVLMVSILRMDEE
ncbi:S-layer homology domain-containing protein [Dysosmobacter sp.]|uniref:S-layer homology domain-containing protein n=1 Tax=Dysosmobacter sp. TaxID=2591382 RepID=UPI002A8846D4|nr:S-layer homology domain-containing protein [Dysosmobacter sp.]MDY3282581.1 S-layer homology domain-containing protein [Dysosmobacter sp.]